MIGNVISDKEGNPLDHNGNKLSESSYNPPKEVKDLFAKVQRDYQVAYALQHRAFDEFDGYSLLQRTKLDQQTFGAYVGCEWLPVHKRWRWKGRKNTARNKLVGILAHMLAGMLYPYVYAKNEQNEEDKLTARVMRILVEEHLRKAGYEMKFLFMVLSALVNPAVFCEVEYLQAMQRIKQRMQSGKIEVIEAVDELLSGLNLNMVPVDELMLADFYTGNLQRQPYILRIRRISYDQARKIYSGKYFNSENKDLFDYVIAGTTRVMLTGQENQTLYDIEWTEADRNYVQEITAYYRDEDLEVTWVGGVGMFEEKEVYNSNPFKHRRLTLIKDKWISVPIYPFAKSGYEPLDPTGRFAYYKSGAFKLYWDDQTLNRMHQLAVDATNLDVMKPIFMSGVVKVDSVVMAPGATIGMPSGSNVTPYSFGPNLKAAYDAIRQQEEDMSVSTQDKVMSGATTENATATEISLANQQAKIALGTFGVMISDLITQIGELTMDCIVNHATVGEMDISVPESLTMKYKTFLAKGKDKGKDITNRVIFTDEFMARTMSKKQVADAEWKLYDESGGDGSDQRIYKVNPYKFARYTYSMYIDSSKMIMKSMGTDRQEKVLAFNMMTDPRVAPYTDRKAVVDDFAIEEFGGDDPDKYKTKMSDDMLNQMLMQGGNAPPGDKPGGAVVPPSNPTTVN